MWNISDVVKKFGSENKLCAQYREALEDLRSDLSEASASAELNRILPTEVLAHAAGCNPCGEAAETFWASRNVLTGPLYLAHDEHTAAFAKLEPWFATRVMARIAEREVEGRRALSEWSTAVTRFASRVAWISAAALVIGSTLLYVPGGRQANAPARQSASPNSPQYLFDGSSVSPSVDDALAGPAER
ncbi:MAG TPA: hypothetical protein VIM00_02960 [Candidatus Acidoferrum sp.]|jgi:hypothetical protein